jgi:hypothetical protein
MVGCSLVTQAAPVLPGDMIADNSVSCFSEAELDDVAYNIKSTALRRRGHPGESSNLTFRALPNRRASQHPMPGER